LKLFKAGSVVNYSLEMLVIMKYPLYVTLKGLALRWYVIFETSSGVVIALSTSPYPNDYE